MKIQEKFHVATNFERNAYLKNDWLPSENKQTWKALERENGTSNRMYDFKVNLLTKIVRGINRLLPLLIQDDEVSPDSLAKQFCSPSDYSSSLIALRPNGVQATSKTKKSSLTIHLKSEFDYAINQQGKKFIKNTGVYATPCNPHTLITLLEQTTFMTPLEHEKSVQRTLNNLYKNALNYQAFFVHDVNDVEDVHCSILKAH